jgi:hypothetical protein
LALDLGAAKLLNNLDSLNISHVSVHTEREERYGDPCKARSRL